MSDYPWERPYAEALLEGFPDKVQQLATIAENAIHDRLEDALHGRPFIDSHERNAIKYALHHFRTLKQGCAA